MVKKRYFAVVGIAAALFMLYAVCDVSKIYLYGQWAEYPFIIAGVVAVLAFAFSAVALLRSLKNSRALLNAAVAVNTAVSVYCYILAIYDELLFSAIAGMLVAVIICAFYFAGICFKREGQNKLFDICSVLVICAVMFLYILWYEITIGQSDFVRIIGMADIVIALAAFMVYSFTDVPRYVWFIVVGIEGALCLVLSIDVYYNFGPAAILGHVALAGVAYMIVYYIASGLHAKGAGRHSSAKGGLSADDIRQLEQLHKLMLQGVISEEQFKTQKDKILGGK